MTGGAEIILQVAGEDATFEFEVSPLASLPPFPVKMELNCDRMFEPNFVPGIRVAGCWALTRSPNALVLLCRGGAGGGDRGECSG